MDLRAAQLLAEIKKRSELLMTAEERHALILDSFEKDRINLDIVRDMAHFFWGFFGESEQREKYKPSLESWLSTMQSALVSYWGPSAEITPDYNKTKFMCTLNDGRELWI